MPRRASSQLHRPGPWPRHAARLAALARSCTDLILVELGEVVDDDGDGQGDDEDAADTASGTDQLAPPGSGVDVAVADSRHRDRRPPERLRYADELRLVHLR